MKKDTSRIHYEALDNQRTKLLDSLATLTKNFVLSGGTALALQIGHRHSFDFDFFSQKEISPNLLVKLKNLLKVSTVLVNTPEELSVMLPAEIKISFIYYPFFKNAGLIELKNGIKMFPFPILAAQKAYTIGRRGTYRDYFDIYVILKEGYLSLDHIIELAQKIYGEIFNPKLFLEQLIYFEDLTNFEIIPIDGKELIPNPKAVKTFLEDQIKKVLLEI